MQNRTPAPAGPVEAFDPVPRKPRHDGWTPERQRAFIEALADTGSVTTACRMVNMSTEGAYFLRRQPGAESFRKAWEAALDCGVLRLKDEAFERAMNGQLVPVFVAGKLMGFRRKKNDRLLMFCLRHYGEDRQGRRTRIDCFAPSAARDLRAAEAPSGPARSAALSPADSVGESGEEAALATLRSFAGVALDAEAQAAIQSALAACAARTRDLEREDDPREVYVDVRETETGFTGELEGVCEIEDFESFQAGEEPWTSLDQPDQRDAIDAAVRAIKAAKAGGHWDRDMEALKAEQEAKAARATMSLNWEDYTD